MKTEIEYFDNGVISSIKSFKGDVRHGLTINYNKDRKSIIDHKFKNGEINLDESTQRNLSEVYTTVEEINQELKGLYETLSLHHFSSEFL